MKRLALPTILITLLLNISLLAQSELTKSDVTTTLPDDATLSAALPRLIPVSNISCSSYPASVSFKLYTNEADNAPVWQETQVIFQNPGGMSNHLALLGATTNGLSAELFSQAHWLGIQCNGQTEMPRTMLASVGYAVKASDSDTLGGQPASAYLLADAVNTSAITSNLNSEISRAQMMEGNLAQDVASELQRAQAAEATLTNTVNQLSALVSTMQAQIAALQNPPATALARTQSTSNISATPTTATAISTQSVTVTRIARTSR